MQKVLTVGDGRGGAAEARIRMVAAESQWPISRWHPKASGMEAQPFRDLTSKSQKEKPWTLL